MQPFTRLTAIAAPLWRPNINTDDIWPGPEASPIVRNGNRAVMTDPEAMGPNAFAAWRWDDQAQPRPEFILNQPPYDEANILIADANFGCGSSREMAVWALMGAGLRCVIAPSFGDIFYNNCFKNGLLPVRLPRDQAEILARRVASPAEATLTVDLYTCTVSADPGPTFRFEILEYHRQALLQGLDEIAATLGRMPAISRFEEAYRAERPWLRWD